MPGGKYLKSASYVGGRGRGLEPGAPRMAPLRRGPDPLGERGLLNVVVVPVATLFFLFQSLI